MRESYQKQLEVLHTELIRMGALCEDAIDSAVKGLLNENHELRQKAVQLEKDIDIKEREIELICVRLLLREQPVAGDLRQIIAAQRIMREMERIGDQAANIALYGGKYFINEAAKSGLHTVDMADAAMRMLTASVDSYVREDLNKAKAVIKMDDEVDALFRQIKQDLIEIISKDSNAGGDCLDILMIAKYLERIGDHAVNIAEWVLYSITGERKEESS
ncbi:MAG: phosphate signaling complex protein PhoU [Spirochaetaceae bacterium]|jgi:phosphate transport system protein|nr:phosphate signaling complex protein PhoU [Spirochaetaceae bacterium]